MQNRDANCVDATVVALYSVSEPAAEGSQPVSVHRSRAAIIGSINGFPSAQTSVVNTLNEKCKSTITNHI